MNRFIKNIIGEDELRQIVYAYFSAYYAFKKKGNIISFDDFITMVSLGLEKSKTVDIEGAGDE